MIIKVFFVQCDECQEYLDNQNEYPTRQEATEQAVKAGWVVCESEIICDKCKT